MAGLIIYLLLPILGVVLYEVLRRSRWRDEEVLTRWYFIVFFFYGGMLMVLLTTLFGEWSGLASAGMFALLAAIPVFPFVGYQFRALARGPKTDHVVLFGLLIGYAPAMGGLIWVSRFL